MKSLTKSYRPGRTEELAIYRRHSSRKAWAIYAMIRLQILIMSAVIGLGYSERSFAGNLYGPGKNTQLHFLKTDEQAGDLLFEVVPDENASTDTPYYYSYEYFSPDDFTPTLRSGLQSIGFSFRPSEDNHKRDVKKCEARKGEIDWSIFWTDWVIINPNLLRDLGIEDRDFEVNLVEPHEYRIQIYGCYRGGTLIEYRQLPNDRCRYGHLPQSAGPNAEALINVDVQHRGSGGAWRDFDNQAFDTQPITTSVNNSIQRILESTESEPRIVFGEPGCI